MDIVIVANFIGNIDRLETENGRFVYLAKELVKENKVEIITSTFIHSLKRQAEQKIDKFEGIKISPLYEKGYSKNVCLSRFASHHEFGKNVAKYLKKRKKPDVVYIAVPSLTAAYESVKYCNKNKIKCIVDVQDLWPEAFEMVLKIPFISTLIFFPFRYRANSIYRNADVICGVSDTYVNRAKKVNRKCEESASVFLGTDLSEFDKWRSEEKLSEKDSVLRLVYVGTLGHSYDLQCVFDAMRMLAEQENNNIAIRIIGDGPLEQQFKEYTKKYSINAEFTGRLPYAEMVQKLTECDIAVNPITKGAAQSIINKVGDYAAAGIPVISTQECQEYRMLLEKYHSGVNCECGSVKEIAKAILYLKNDETMRKGMGANQRLMAEKLFDRKITYKKLIKMVKIKCEKDY